MKEKNANIQYILAKWVERNLIDKKMILNEWLEGNGFSALYKDSNRCFCFRDNVMDKCENKNNADCFPVRFVVIAEDENGKFFHLDIHDRDKFVIKKNN